MRSFEQHLREIGQYAVAPICRHQLITRHFDQVWPPDQSIQASDNNCGACDVCLGETKKIPDEEALVLAQKIISGVWRCGNRFGSGHVIDVLRGKRTEKVLQHKHQDLSVFGLLDEYREPLLRAWLDQLIVQEYLCSVEKNGYPIVAITESGQSLCKGHGSVHLSTVEIRGKKTKYAAPKKETAEDWQGVDRDLFENFRELRKCIADAIEKPPYIVFSDASLRDMARLQPTDNDEFLLVHGVGKQKATSYGPAFIDLVMNGDIEHAYSCYQDV